MRNNFFLTILILVLSCKSKTENSKVIKKEKEQNTTAVKLSIKETDLESFYYYDTLYSQYKIKLALNNVKETDNNYRKIGGIKELSGIKMPSKYAFAKEFKLNNYHYKIFLYTVDIENDMNSLVTLLNCYDSTMQLTDALILDSRFTFESYFYSNYVINDSIVKLYKNEKQLLVFDKDGAIIGEQKRNITKTDSVFYKIDNKGKFIRK